jgi:hypothetical protein
MGTRADFYDGRGRDAEWLGSIAWDGYPDGLTPLLPRKEPSWHGGPERHVSGSWAPGGSLLEASTVQEFHERLEHLFNYRDDVTRPADGWPWPWDDSDTTDYAYAFEGGKVWISCFGSAWHDESFEVWDEENEKEIEPPGPVAVFPDMSGQKHSAPAGSKRSGVMVISAPSTEPEIGAPHGRE